VTATRRPLARSALELVVIVATALVLAVAIQAFLVKPYKIPSGSMLPTLRINERVLVDRIGTHFSSPKVGQIIVFHPPQNFDSGCANPTQGAQRAGQPGARPCDALQSKESSQTFIKRLVGLPGDRLSIVNGHVIRNGKAEKDSYIVPCASAICNFPGTITVPAGDYYMMGDNRPDSEDSRFWGPVPKRWIIGQAFLTYWPVGRLGLL
jgi:signal peptidase I